MRTSILCLLIGIAFHCAAQGWGDNDSLRVIELQQRGIQIKKGRVVAWFPSDSLSKSRMNGIVDTLNIGIEAVEKWMRAPLAWQVFADTPITFYFSPERFISHASWEGYVFIPFWRIKLQQAPWLHESLHVLLRSSKGNWGEVSAEERKENMPLWLTEGLPDYIDMKVSYIEHIPRFDLWKDGGFLKTDSSCQSKLSGPKGEYILGYVGKKGPLSELFGENRSQYAPTFYNCSNSFVKYIGEQYGLDVLLEAISSIHEEHERIESRTHKTMDSLKEEWLTSLKR